MTTAPIPRPDLAVKPEPPLYEGQVITATFAPAPRWSEDIQRHAGARCRWRAAWVVAEGACRGERACIPIAGAVPGLSWAPESELVERK